MPLKATKKRDNNRKYPHIGGSKNLPRNVVARREMSELRLIARSYLTTEDQLRIIEQRPGNSLRERARLLAK